MLLAIDVGNSQLFAGVFEGDALRLTFRLTTPQSHSSDEFGLFLRSVLRENGVNHQDIEQVVIGSVVPEINHSLSSACIKYFDSRPLFINTSIVTNIEWKCRNPEEVGADRVAAAMAAAELYPDTNLAIVDFGTANTICVMDKNRHWFGGLIAPGLRLSMEALQENTARLPTVEIQVPKQVVGRDTIENIQSGLYMSAAGMVKETVAQLKNECFNGEPIRVIGTGGFARLFDKAGIFQEIVPNLVLIGLKVAWKLNQGK